MSGSSTLQYSYSPLDANEMSNDRALLAASTPLSFQPTKAVGRGRAARAEARDRKNKREAEEARRASVWGQQGEKKSQKATSRKTPRTSLSPTAAAATTPPAPRASSSLFAAVPDASKATAAPRGDRPEAATRIQASFRGGRARRDAELRRKESQQRKAEAVARAQEKVRARATVGAVLSHNDTPNSILRVSEAYSKLSTR